MLSDSIELWLHVCVGNCVGKKAGEAPAFREDSRQRLTFPRGCPRSIISAEGLNYRVRDGYGWIPFAIATGKVYKNI